MAPELTLPLYWNEHWFSSISYLSGTSAALERTNTVKYATAATQEVITLNLLSYQSRLGDVGYALGVGARSTRIDKNEFGYLYDYNTSFDNSVGIEYLQAMIQAEASYRPSSDVAMRLTLLASPYATLGVNQTIELIPLRTTQGSANGTKTQSMSFELSYDLFIHVSPWVDFALRGSYVHLPLSYAYKDLNYDTAQEDITEDTYYADIKLPFRKKMLGLFPFVGMRFSATSITNNLTKATATVESQSTIFGFENRF